MSEADPPGFLDSNVLIYLISGDARKADQAERLLAARPLISVQVLNEVTWVCRRKLGMSWEDIGAFLCAVRPLCTVVPLTEAIHDRARNIAERHQIAFYDACIVAAAVESGCKVLFTEDLSDGQKLAGEVTVRNPFLAAN